MLSRILRLRKWFYVGLVTGISQLTWAQSIPLLNPQAQDVPHQLKFDKPLSDDQTQARALLLPEAQEVTVANRLI
jgi:hypothetical protein